VARPFRLRLLLSLVVLGFAGMLGGCVVYSAYPAYPPYGYGYAPYYGGGYIAFAGGGGWPGGGGWHY
jgi:hypothetical protein